MKIRPPIHFILFFIVSLGLAALLPSACGTSPENQTGPTPPSSGPNGPGGGDDSGGGGGDAGDPSAVVHCSNGQLAAFPGAEGFGACATGGRAAHAQVIYVTNNNGDGPGSLQAAFDIGGPRYIVFSTSGVIPTVHITQGDVTIAGQTSPGGIIVRGLICDNVYDPNHCRNVIVRHLKSRPGGGDSDGDALRIGGADLFIADHLSLENAVDEACEISRSSQVTVQNSILAETLGEHNQFGGMLLNYSTEEREQQNISIHHNAYIRLGGRTPLELSCEENTDGGLTPNCDNHHLSLEVSNNLVWDAQIELWYNECVGNNEGNREDHGGVCSGLQFTDLNWVGNVTAFKGDNVHDMISHVLYQSSGNQIFASDNLRIIGNSGEAYHPSISNPASGRLSYPTITYTPAADLIAYARRYAGAFPRDNMDNRLLGYLASSVDSSPTNPPTAGVNPAGDAYPGLNGSAPTDTDRDGMPDAWETAHGLDPNIQDHNGTNLSSAGYSNLEVYLNELSDRLIQNQP